MKRKRLINHGGGGLVQQLRRSYSLSDLTECEPREERGSDEADDVLTEPRMIRQGAKSGFVTRRSASESNSRSPMYFPEVDVDVRPRPRSDEPDFSHIKSSEDISSGYSSADNSASLSRTASLGAAARARSRISRTAVTAIKRPQAAEESEVIIEELQDDDTFEYSNMPPLINLPSPLFLSHTQPPFIYQYVGDQVKILQVLGKYPLNVNSNNITNDTDHWDQKEASSIEAIFKKPTEQETVTNDDFNDALSDIPIINPGKDHNADQPNKDFNDAKIAAANITNDQNKQDKKEMFYINLDLDNLVGCNSLDPSVNDIDSVESDDEASFGTPENSPKHKRKSPQGKYGKAKAPPPPICDSTSNENKETSNKSDGEDNLLKTVSQEILVDIVNKKTKTIVKESGSKSLQVVNPIAENKRRHKSKSPGRLPKGYSAGLGKFLQLPGRLAFWNRTEDINNLDDVSTSSGDHSRSSTVERVIDEFQSSTDLDAQAGDQKNCKASADDNTENISKDISDKSEALQKLIDAKLVSHPEYKIISLHEEVPTVSKSTDV